MNLGVDRKPPVVEAFDQVALPQRAVAVEQSSVQSRGQFQQFTHPARRRQCRSAQVVLEVELAVEGPGEVDDSAEKFGGMLTEGLADVVADHQLLIDVAEVVRPGAGGGFEDLEPGDVHGMLARLREEKHRIQRRNQFHELRPQFDRRFNRRWFY